MSLFGIDVDVDVYVYVVGVISENELQVSLCLCALVRRIIVELKKRLEEAERRRAKYG